jgi:L-fucose mutarotase
MPEPAREMPERTSGLVPEGTQTEFVDRFGFYALARSENLALCIVTGDSRRFANALLTVGVLDRS